MSSEDQTAVPDAPDKTEPNVEATEQKNESYADTLLALAREETSNIAVAEPPEDRGRNGET